MSRQIYEMSVASSANVTSVNEAPHGTPTMAYITESGIFHRRTSTDEHAYNRRGHNLVWIDSGVAPVDYRQRDPRYELINFGGGRCRQATWRLSVVASGANSEYPPNTSILRYDLSLDNCPTGRAGKAQEERSS
jgi:hypothetical protein